MIKRFFVFAIVLMLAFSPTVDACFYSDNDFDGSDLATLAAEFDTCNSDCNSDFVGDGDVDIVDVKTFASNFGCLDCLPPLAIGEIGPDGGIIEVIDAKGDASGTIVDIKNNSIDEATNISISEISVLPDLPPHYAKAGIALHLGPDGLHLNNPALLCLPYLDQDNDGVVDGTDVSEESVQVLCFDNTENIWNPVAVMDRDLNNNKVTVQINQLGLYVTYVGASVDDLIDQHAIPEATNLYNALKTINDSEKFIFGQHMALTILMNENKIYDATKKSDCRTTTGKDPGFIESDFMWYKYPIDPEAVKVGEDEIEYEYDSMDINDETITFQKHDIETLITAYRDKNIIIGYCWHIRGRYSGEFSLPENPSESKIIAYNKDKNLVAEILDPNDPSGSRKWFLDELKKEVIDVLKIYQDNNVPIIFRPWHEMNGDWFWWGSSSCSDEQFKALWKLTVNTIQEHGIHNVIYAWSCDEWFERDEVFEGDEADGVRYYPGDDVVDLIGFDGYEPGLVDYYTTDDFFEQLFKISDFSYSHGKVFSIAETGDRIRENSSDFWTKNILNPIIANNFLDRLAYISTWNNGYGEYFVPYEGMQDDTAVNDFIRFKKSEFTLFDRDYNGNLLSSNNNMIAYWSFDYATSNEMGIDDLAAHNGSVFGNTKPLYDFVANSCYFDGLGDYIQISPSLTALTDSNFTIMTWINIAGLPRFDENRASFFVSDADCLSHKFEVADLSNTNPMIRFSAATGCNQSVALGAEVNLDKWYFVAATCDGTNLCLTVWDDQKNRIFSDSVTIDAPLAAWDGSVKIGGNDRLGRYFNGSLDEMRVFNQALSVDEIQSYIDPN